MDSRASTSFVVFAALLVARTARGAEDAGGAERSDAVDAPAVLEPPPPPSSFVRVTAGVGGVGLHPLGAHVDRLGVSTVGLFVEGLAGVPLGRFVVAGAVDAFFARRERVRFPDDSLRRIDRSFQVVTAGPVLLWSPWGGGAGFHAGLGPRAFWVPAQGAIGDVARLPAQFGAGMQAQAGHSWEVGNSRAIGVDVRLGWGTTFRDDTGVSAYQFLQLTLGASCSFK